VFGEEGSLEMEADGKWQRLKMAVSVWIV